MLTSETLELSKGRKQIVYRSGDGPPIVWLHAADGIADGHPLIDELAQRYTVIAPLAPGFHELAELDEVQSIHELAMHYDDVLEALGLDEATVIGHSFGGMIAAELAAHYPKRVSRLVLIAPVGLWNDEYPVLDIFAVPLAELPGVLYADPSLMQAPPNVSSREDADVEALVTLVRGMTSVAKFMWPIPDRGLARRLDRISAPTLVVFGDADALVPARYADDFGAGIAGSSTAIIPGGSHMVPVERTGEVLAAIDRFLASAGSALAGSGATVDGKRA
jgi:pimeloyl-ACP methyl ester carboxylesterase